MNKLMRKIAAVSVALVMSVSASGASVSAVSNADTGKIQGWVLTEEGWVYVMPDGKKAVDRLVKIDGILYEFDMRWPHIFQKYTGWAKFSEMVNRRFSHGLPYTGWLRYDDGKLCYCIDGYSVKEKTQIGDSIYTFDDNGIYQSETKLSVIAECPEEISADAEKISITVKSLDDGSCSIKSAENMERWERGRWVDCKGKRKVPTKKQTGNKAYVVDDKSKAVTISFNPQEYTKNGFTEGYYRIPIESVVSGEKQISYAMFRVIPPVEVNMSEIIYFDSGDGAAVEVVAEIKSDKPDVKNLEAHIFKMTADGWKDITEYEGSDGKVSTEVIPINEINDGAISYGMKIKDGTGYYKAVIHHKSKNKKYTDYFRIERLEAKPWSELYSTKSDKMIVHFDVENNTSYNVFFRNDAVTLYKAENGGWIEVTEGRNAVEESSEVLEERQKVIELSPKEKTSVSVNVSDYYNISELGAGEYAVYFSGIGYQSFTVTTDELPAEDYPYAAIKDNEVEGIVLEDCYCEGSDVLEVDEQDMEYVIDWLRHFNMDSTKPHGTYDLPAGGVFKVSVAYTDGTDETLLFYGNAVLKDKKYYEYPEYYENAMQKLVEERLGLDN